MRKKLLDDAGRVLEVIDGFKQRNHRQRACQTIVAHFHEPRFASKQIHREQIGGATRHRYNQRAKPGIAAARTMRDKHAITVEHRIRFGTGGDARCKKWPR